LYLQSARTRNNYILYVVDNTLINKLSSYNENSTGKIISDEAGRRWWQAMLNFCAIAEADIGRSYGGVQASSVAIGTIGLSTGGVGAAIVGGGASVVCRAGASYAAYQSLRGQAPAAVSYRGLAILLSDECSNLSQIEKSHNNIIHNYFFHQGNIELSILADKIDRFSLLRKNEKFTQFTDSHFCHGASGVARFYFTLFFERGLMDGIQESLRFLD
jgi:hypothetical protein